MSLRLVVWRESAGFVDGSVKIGLFDHQLGEDDDDLKRRIARELAVKHFHYDEISDAVMDMIDERAERLVGNIEVVPMGQFTEIVKIPTDYEG